MMISPSKGMDGGPGKSKRSDIMEQLDRVSSFFFSRLQGIEDYLENNLREDDFGFQMQEFK